jgi:hypothetical protein
MHNRVEKDTARDRARAFVTSMLGDVSVNVMPVERGNRGSALGLILALASSIPHPGQLYCMTGRLSINEDYHKYGETKPHCSARYLEDGSAIIEGLHKRAGQHGTRGEDLNSVVKCI